MMDRGVRPAEREILPGVTLAVSASGSHFVYCNGVLVGRLHASAGDHWQACVCRPGEAGHHVGRLRQDDAVKAIMRAREKETSRQADLTPVSAMASLLQETR
jgi:hypothetical protein